MSKVQSPGVSKMQGSCFALDLGHLDLGLGTERRGLSNIFLRSTSPSFTWDWPYQKYLYKKLNDVTTGKTKRLMIFMPPRHGKSELVTVRYTAWRLSQDPTLNVIVGSYNQKLANRFSRKIKNSLHDSKQSVPPAASEHRSVSSLSSHRSVPGAVATGAVSYSRRSQARLQPPADAGGTDQIDSPLPRRINTSEEWETRQGGTVRAVGVGGGITGYGAGLIIIDDPVKSRAEAESRNIRDKVFDWFNDDLYTRLEPDAPIILIQTRWHEDDLAGRLLAEAAEDANGEKWEVVSFPAIAEEEWNADAPVRNECKALTTTAEPNTPSPEEPATADEGVRVPSDLLGRLPGEPLCPARFSIEQLERIKLKLGTYSFSALYQQRPVPPEGSIFKRNWFKIIDKALPDSNGREDTILLSQQEIQQTSPPHSNVRWTRTAISI